MKRNDPHIFFKTIVTVFLAAYLAGCFANMLCIPRYVPDAITVAISNSPARANTLRANFSNINFLKPFDRYNVDNDAINKLTFTPKSVDVGFRFGNTPVEVNTIPPPKIHPYNNFQHSYLSFCTFRI